MKIDTNLRLQKQTQGQTQKQTNTDTNLHLDKYALLRPNAPRPQEEDPEEEIRLSREELEALQKLDIESIYKELINQRQPQIPIQKPPINLPAATEDLIRTCISKRYKAELFYDGGQRIVEIYCYGQNTAGHNVIRVFQTS
ncbi:MAG TPA: hypothetical protein VNY73_09540, partial [Bacteroidia bacterium]|nr:hypothetical protein [Bacteroidia bacterium]